ncbi:hypothetical protein Pmani_013278 [Petrolisthes manimaculis]|uniref:Uncharacterized protein n=1 Tax=Petrolisthes manimaculis TaxID=1843537 RepID=A0AAE1PWT1_9EUCA|nr:hypothetical protein Pmani_013278 [Petrolisthes manimaculis]
MDDAGRDHKKSEVRDNTRCQGRKSTRKGRHEKKARKDDKVTQLTLSHLKNTTPTSANLTFSCTASAHLALSPPPCPGLTSVLLA